MADVMTTLFTISIVHHSSIHNYCFHSLNGTQTLTIIDSEGRRFINNHINMNLIRLLDYNLSNPPAGLMSLNSAGFVVYTSQS